MNKGLSYVNCLNEHESILIVRHKEVSNVYIMLQSLRFQSWLIWQHLWLLEVRTNKGPTGMFEIGRGDWLHYVSIKKTMKSTMSSDTRIVNWLPFYMKCMSAKVSFESHTRQADSTTRVNNYAEWQLQSANSTLTGYCWKMLPVNLVSNNEIGNHN